MIGAALPGRGSSKGRDALGGGTMPVRGCCGQIVCEPQTAFAGVYPSTRFYLWSESYGVDQAGVLVPRRLFGGHVLPVPPIGGISRRGPGAYLGAGSRLSATCVFAFSARPL